MLTCSIVNFKKSKTNEPISTHAFVGLLGWLVACLGDCCHGVESSGEFSIPQNDDLFLAAFQVASCVACRTGVFVMRFRRSRQASAQREVNSDSPCARLKNAKKKYACTSCVHCTAAPPPPRQVTNKTTEKLINKEKKGRMKERN